MVPLLHCLCDIWMEGMYMFGEKIDGCQAVKLMKPTSSSSPQANSKGSIQYFKLLERMGTTEDAVIEDVDFPITK